jgi:hypothetical protein
MGLLWRLLGFRTRVVEVVEIVEVVEVVEVV